MSSNISKLAFKIVEMKARIRALGVEPTEIYVSYKDFEDMENFLGKELDSIAGMRAIPDTSLEPGTCRIELS